jgi:putative salt-induced outer membrane protein YdiY
MPRKLASATVLTALALLAHPVRAQKAAADTGKAKKDTTLKTTAALAFVDASGNTNVTTLTVNERLEWRRPRFLWTQSLNAINSTDDGEETADLLAIGVRGDWKPKGRFGVYALGSFDRDRFAELRHRFEEGTGLAYGVLDDKHNRLSTEIGVQFVQQQNLEKVDNNFTAGRLAEFYRYSFKEDRYIEERVEYLPNFEQSEDYRVNAEAALIAPFSRHFSLKLGYVVRFDNLPEPDVKKTDRFFTSGLQVTF